MIDITKYNLNLFIPFCHYFYFVFYRRDICKHNIHLFKNVSFFIYMLQYVIQLHMCLRELFCLVLSIFFPHVKVRSVCFVMNFIPKNTKRVYIFHRVCKFAFTCMHVGYFLPECCSILLNIVRWIDLNCKYHA